MTNGIQLVEKFAGAMLLAFPYIAYHNCDYVFIGNSVFLVYTVIAHYYIFSVFNSYNAMKHITVGFALIEYNIIFLKRSVMNLFYNEKVPSLF